MEGAITRRTRIVRLLAGAALASALALPAACASSAAPGGSAKPDSFSAASVLGSAAPSILDELPKAEGAGKVLVVYFSGGNASERVAEDLAALFSADVERLREKKRRAKGFLGFMGAGMDATFGFATRIEPPARDPAAYDRVFVLTPVWSWSLCPPVRTWLGMNEGKLPPAAFITVSGDTRPDKIAASMAGAGGRKPFAVAGFSERDFRPENRGDYVERIRALRDALPSP